MSSIGATQTTTPRSDPGDTGLTSIARDSPLDQTARRAGVADPATGGGDTPAYASDRTTAERLAGVRTQLQRLTEEPSRLEALGSNLAAANDATPNGLTGAAQGLVDGGRRVTIGNPELKVRYETTTSAVTGKGGINVQAAEQLRSFGFEAVEMPNQTPPGSLLRTDPGFSNTHNGNIARDAIAARYDNLGDPNVTTRIEAKFDVDGRSVPPEVRGRNHNLPGDRNVDVRVDIGNPTDPRFSSAIDIESKAYRLTPSSLDAGQVAQDATRLDANRALRGGGFALEGLGRVARPVGLVLDAVDVGTAIKRDGGIGVNTGEAVSGLAGGAAGGWGGATAGAAIGTAILPGVGTVIGGLVGAGIGAWGGDAAGRGVFGTVRGWFE